MPYSRRNLKKKGTKVSLKQNNRLKFRKGKFGSEAVQKVWDNKKTLRQNYEKLGLVSDTNKMEEAKAPEHPLIEFVSTEDVKKDEIIMSVYDQNYMKKLIEKHGDDLEAMFRDIKVNVDQLSVGQLRKKYDKYMRLQEKFNATKPAASE
ncbi:hypothetical protein WA538_000393 [Blastocystis sp. DL]